MASEGRSLLSSGHQTVTQDALVEVIVGAVSSVLRCVLDGQLGQDQIVPDMADGVALEGAHLVVSPLKADLKPVLLVVVDHIDDLGFRDPLVPEAWGP